MNPAYQTPMFLNIRDPELRRLLDHDYGEFRLALSNRMTKASLVLAGGIIEAILLNFLEVIGYQTTHEGRDPRMMQLGELITACRQEGALTSELVSQCQLLQEYRNLIHLGRCVRNQEVPNEAVIEVVEKLVERVVEQVNERARQRPEWGPEALLEFYYDGNTLYWQFGEALVIRRLRALPPEEADRLVCELLPDWFALELATFPDKDDNPWITFFEDLVPFFQTAFVFASPEAKSRLAARLLQECEASPDWAPWWLMAYMRGPLLASADVAERNDLVRLTAEWTLAICDVGWYADDVLEAVAPYLSADDADRVMRLLLIHVDWDKQDDRELGYLRVVLSHLSEETASHTRQEMDKFTRMPKYADNAAHISALRYEIWPLNDSEIPR